MKFICIIQNNELVLKEILSIKTLSEMELMVGRNVDSVNFIEYFIQWAKNKQYNYIAPNFYKLKKQSINSPTLKVNNIYNEEELSLDNWEIPLANGDWIKTRWKPLFENDYRQIAQLKEIITNEQETVLTAQEFLDKKDLHWMYPPNGDWSKPLLHDCDCRFCDVEERVLEAMEEYAQYCIEQLK